LLNILYFYGDGDGMFFVRLLLLFAALYFAPVHADDCTKRLSQDHHHFKTHQDALSLGNPSCLATLAAIYKEQHSQHSHDDDQSEKSALRKNYSIAISSRFDLFKNVIIDSDGDEQDRDGKSRKNKLPNERRIIATSSVDPTPIFELIIKFWSENPDIGAKIVDGLGKVAGAIFVSDLANKAADRVTEKNQSNATKDQQQKDKYAQDTLQHATNLKNAGIAASPGTLVTMCDLPNGNKGTKISDAQGNEIIFEIKDGYAYIVDESVARPGTNPSLFDYTTRKTEEQIDAENKRQKAQNDFIAKAQKKFNDKKEKEKEAQAKADKITSKNNKKAASKKAEIDRDERIKKAEDEQNIKNQQAQEQLAHEAKRIESLLPPIFDAPKRDKHGNLPRTKDGAYIDGKGQTFKLNPVTNIWDIKNKSGHTVFQNKYAVSTDAQSSTPIAEKYYDQPKAQTSEVYNPAPSAVAEPAKKPVIHTMTFEKATMPKDVQSQTPIAEKAYENQKSQSSGSSSSAASAVAEPVTKSAESKPVTSSSFPTEKSHAQPVSQSSATSSSAQSAAGAEAAKNPAKSQAATSSNLPKEKSHAEQKAQSSGTPSLGEIIKDGPALLPPMMGLMESIGSAAKTVGQGAKELGTITGKGLVDVATQVGQGAEKVYTTIAPYTSLVAPVAVAVGAVVGIGYLGYRAVKYCFTPIEDKPKSPLKTTAQEPQQPKQQGCGDWQNVDNGQKTFTSPTPEVKDTNHGGCGKPHPDAPAKLTHTGHGPQPEISQELPGCGQPLSGLENAHEQPGCGGMDVAEQQSDIFKISEDGKTWIGSDGKTRKIGDLSDVDVKYRDDNKYHIFKDRPGHLIDNIENRERIRNLVKNPTKFFGDDNHNNWWYAEILPDGTQLWGETRGDKITNCGLNKIPKPYNKNSGFCDFDPSKQKNK
jgi:hypothetical protein